MNKTGKVLIIAGITFLTGLIIAVYGLSMVQRKIRRQEPVKSEYAEYVYESKAAGKDITYFGIDIPSDDINIKTGSSDKIVIRYKDKKVDPDITVLEEDGVLTLGYAENKKSFHVEFNIPKLEEELSYVIQNGGFDTYSINVELPSGVSPEIYLETVSGDISMDSINVGKSFYLKTSSGEVELTNCIIPECTGFSTVSGDIRMDSVVVKNHFAAVTSSGEVKLKNVSFDGNISVQTVSGDITLNDSVNKGELFIDTSSGEVILRNVKSAGDASLTTISGDVDINDMESIGFRASTSSGEFNADKLFLTQSAYISTISGDVDIKFDMKKSDCTLRTSTVSGDASPESFDGGKQMIEITTSSGNIDTEYK